MYDADDHKTIKKLLDQFGQETCLHLGFLGQDDNAMLYVTMCGLGYLLEIEAAEITALHEAYAVGFRQGYDQAENLT